MLCSYGFILQLRRSPTPCCAGNGTLVTRVHRVQLACVRQAAQSWRIRASSLPFDFWCKLGLFDLCCLEKQSAALREGACLSERAGCRMVRSRQAGSTGEGRPDGQSHQGLGSQSRHHALLCREGSDGFGGSWITPNCLASLGFLWEPTIRGASWAVTAVELRSDSRDRAGPRALVFHPVRFSLSYGFVVIGS